MDKEFHLFSSKYMKSILKTIFAIVFIGIIFYKGRKELASIKIDDVIMVLKSLPPYILILFIVGGISSAGVRVILYGKEGIETKEATYYNILIVTSFSTGLSALTLIVLFNLNSIHPIFEQYEFALIATIIIIFYVPLFFMINKFKWMKKKLLGENASKFISYNLLKKLFMSSIFEWTTSALFFCLISLYFSSNAKFIDIFSIFIISSVIGVVSLIPGAIGAFDVTLLLGMSSINIDSNKAVASLMIFRLFYYVLPLIIALVISIPQFLKKDAK